MTVLLRLSLMQEGGAVSCCWQFRLLGVLDWGGYGLGVFRAQVETFVRFRAAGRRRPAPSRGTAPPGC